MNFILRLLVRRAPLARSTVCRSSAAVLDIGGLGVALDVGPDEGAEGDDRQPALAYVVEGEGDQLAPQPLTLEAIVDLGMGEGDLARADAVLGEAGDLAVDADL